jgi:hypothetical protein
VVVAALAGAPGAVVFVPGGMPFAGEVAGGICPAGAAGAVAEEGLVGAVAVAGEPAAGGAGGVWPNDVSASVREQRETVSSVFIGLSERSLRQLDLQRCWLSATGLRRVEQNFRQFSIRRYLAPGSHSLDRIIFASGM